MGKIRLKDVYYFLQGNIREFLYNHVPILVRKHIKEQFVFRTHEAERCYRNGSCLSCGCITPGLFFADKGCSLANYPVKVRLSLMNQRVPCYGPMKTKEEWKEFKKRLKKEDYV